MDSVENARAFLSVVEVGSFNGAALRLGVAASVVTKRVGALEKELNTLLFRRTTRSIELTANGRETVTRARDFLSSYERLTSPSSADGSELTGRLRIKAPSSFTNHFLGKILNAFFLMHPKVDVALQLANRPVDPVLEGFDFVITGLPISYDGIEEFPLCLFKRMVYASPKYLERKGVPKHPSEFAVHDCLLYSYLSPVYEWTFNAPGAGRVVVRVNGTFSTNDIDAMHRAAIDGMGIAVLPRYRATESVNQGLLVPILSEYALPDYWIKVLRPIHHHNPKLFQALLEFLRRSLHDLAAAGVLL